MIQRIDELRRIGRSRVSPTAGLTEGASPMRALHTAATGMMAQELNVQVISNNIANLRTTGYKRQQAQFQDLLYETFRARRLGDLGPGHAWCRPASRSARASRPPRRPAS